MADTVDAPAPAPETDPERCHAVLEHLKTLPVQDCVVMVEPTPGEVLEVDFVALYAQSMTGKAKLVNLQLPSVKALLHRLAEDGFGHTAELNDVRYKFLRSKSKASLRSIEAQDVDALAMKRIKQPHVFAAVNVVTMMSAEKRGIESKAFSRDTEAKLDAWRSVLLLAQECHADWRQERWMEQVLRE